MSKYLHLLAQVIQFTQDDLKNLPQKPATKGNLHNILQLVFGFAGAVTFLMVTFGGFKYVISQGDPSATAKAKNTILYALIGLVVCVTAFGIVTFVIGKT